MTQHAHMACVENIGSCRGLLRLSWSDLQGFTISAISDENPGHHMGFWARSWPLVTVTPWQPQCSQPKNCCHSHSVKSMTLRFLSIEIPLVSIRLSCTFWYDLMFTSRLECYDGIYSMTLLQLESFAGPKFILIRCWSVASNGDDKATS